jgi:hypothetical protein
VKRFFPVREEADRWAVDLKQALATGGGDADSLARAIAVPVATINQWIDRKAEIPNSAQALIAAFLRRPAYQLFSDISPPP